MAKKKTQSGGGTPPAAPQPSTSTPPAGPPPEATEGGLASGFALAIWAALLAASGAALYLLYAYIQVTYSAEAFDSACNFNETLNCDKLNTSQWGKIAGIPITVFAVPTYLALGLLVAFAKRGGAKGRAALDLVIVGSGGAVVYGLVLLAVMVFIEHVYCVFCLTMDAAAVITLVLALLGRKQLGAGDRSWPTALMPAVSVGVIGLVVSFGWFASQRASGEDAMKAAATAEAKDTEAELAALQESGGGDVLKATGEARLIAGNLYEIPVDADDAVYGPADAPVTVVEYADFACGYCKKLSFSLGQMKKTYEGKVRWVFKHFPMNPECNSNIKNTRHKNACEAAVASDCARQQGKFWELHDLMFKNQHKLDDPDLRHYAAEIGMDLARFDQCLKSPEAMRSVQGDITQGGAIDLGGTPRTFVNGRLFKGVAAAAIEQAIQQAIGGQGLPAVKQDPPARVPSPAEVAQLAPMTRIERGNGTAYFIDTFEASVDSKSRALSLYGVLPANSNWYDAKASCEAAGKRICSTEEWVTACQSADAIDDDGTGSFADDYVEGNQFPYADWHERGWCHDAADGNTGAPVTAGSSIRCRTEAGVYDLGGNVAEWAGVGEAEAVLLGGDFGSADKAGCFRPNSTWGPGHKNNRMGFRCCADGAVANVATEAVDAIAEQGLEGQPSPEFTGTLMGGGELSSSTLKGKVTYLTFFASWCTPCRREFPELKAMQQEYGSRGFQVISVGVDREPEKSEGFARSQSVSFPIILDPKGLIQGLFDVKSMPTTYIIDKKGVIQHKQVGFSPETTPPKVRPVIDRLLAE